MWRSSLYFWFVFEVTFPIDWVEFKKWRILAHSFAVDDRWKRRGKMSGRQISTYMLANLVRTAGVEHGHICSVCPRLVYWRERRTQIGKWRSKWWTRMKKGTETVYQEKRIPSFHYYFSWWVVLHDCLIAKDVDISLPFLTEVWFNTMEPMNLSRHAIRRHALHTSEDYFTLSTLRTVRGRRELTESRCRVVCAWLSDDFSSSVFFFRICGRSVSACLLPHNKQRKFFNFF